jgi:DNA-binding HxlR family transcriptional regulator
MRSYHQYCPIARGAEVFATRWTPVIVRNLLLGCRTFGELRDGAPGIPRSVLSERLRQLEHHGIVRRRENPRGRGWIYEPTEAGEQLRAVCDALGGWGARWIELGPQHLDPYYSLWAMTRGMKSVELPEERVNTRFELPDMPRTRRRFWLLVQGQEPEICVKPPGFDEDLVVTTDAEWLARWVLGQTSLGRGIKAGRVEVEGPRQLIRLLRQWGEQGARALQTWGEAEPAAGAA